MHDGVLGERVGDEDANPIALDRLDGRGRRLNVVARKASDHAGGDLSLHRLDDELDLLQSVASNAPGQGPAIERHHRVLAGVGVRGERRLSAGLGHRRRLRDGRFRRSPRHRAGAEEERVGGADDLPPIHGRSLTWSTGLRSGARNSDHAAASESRPTSGPRASGGHFPADLGASPAMLDASLHVADLLAGAGAVLADFGALGTGVLVMRAPEQHEVRGGPADLGAGQHQAEVLGLDMLSTGRQAVGGRHAKAGLVTTEAFVDAGLHLGFCMMHGVARGVGRRAKPYYKGVSRRLRAGRDGLWFNLPAGGIVPS